ncbi:MAG TPA: xanthine dehydrogenase family protein subunit M [Gemmatimonadales bacterium]|jgi:xanthine dehydrogenase YagS FAD-binding subunit
MRPFDLSMPADVPAALALLQQDPKARVIAGGTTLLDLMKLDVETPAHVIDITPLARREPSLVAITTLPNGGMRLGALVGNTTLAVHPLVGTRYPMLTAAIEAGASPQVRNMATMGGNLLQRTRCYYFRDTTLACNKRTPGSGCSAIGGHTRMHAILGTSTHCIATHPSDMCVALAALEATIRVRGPAGERTIPFEEFHTRPGDHPEIENTLRPAELVIAIDLPPPRFARHSAYVKVRDRASFAFALASAAVGLDIATGKIRAARVALGGVGTKPWRAVAAERLLTGASAASATWQHAAEAAFADASPQPGNTFKATLGQRTLVRALEMAAAG